MDLKTISNRLDQGFYKNPWDLVEDMWLMFDNARIYNKKNSHVYKCCNKLHEVFTNAINPVMRQMGYCCGQKLSFTPLSIFCYSQSMCLIPRDQPYYQYETGSSQFGVVVNEKHIYCVKCFENLPPEGINLSGNPTDPPKLVSSI